MFMARESRPLGLLRVKPLALRESAPATRGRSPVDDESRVPAFGRTRIALLAAVWCAMVALPAAPVAYAHLTAPSSAQRYLVYLDGYDVAKTHPIDARSPDFCVTAVRQAPHRLHDAFRFGCNDGSALGGHPNSPAYVDKWLDTD
jgi:hypothetical protein